MIKDTPKEWLWTWFSVLLMFWTKPQLRPNLNPTTFVFIPSPCLIYFSFYTLRLKWIFSTMRHVFDLCGWMADARVVLINGSCCSSLYTLCRSLHLFTAQIRPPAQWSPHNCWVTSVTWCLHPQVKKNESCPQIATHPKQGTDIIHSPVKWWWFSPFVDQTEV